MNRARLAALLKDAGWWVLRRIGLIAFLIFDAIWSLGFAIAVFVMCDLPAGIEAWKWRRARRRNGRTAGDADAR